MSIKKEQKEINLDMDYEQNEENEDVVAIPITEEANGDSNKKVKKRYFQQFRMQWLKDPRNKDWLRRIDGNSTKCYCKYCNTKLAAKLSDIEKHRNTRKHRTSQEEYYSLKNLMVNDPLSDEDLYNQSLHAAFRIDDSFRDDVEETPSYGSESSEFFVKRFKSGKVKNYPVKQELFNPAENFVSKEEDEIDSFAKSIAAQMKMLREEDTIELTFEIQNLVTQRRRRLMEAKLAEKQVENNDVQQQVITVSVDHPQLQSVVNN